MLDSSYSNAFVIYIIIYYNIFVNNIYAFLTNAALQYVSSIRSHRLYRYRKTPANLVVFARVNLP